MWVRAHKVCVGGRTARGLTEEILQLWLLFTEKQAACVHQHGTHQ